MLCIRYAENVVFLPINHLVYGLLEASMDRAKDTVLKRHMQMLKCVLYGCSHPSALHPSLGVRVGAQVSISNTTLLVLHTTLLVLHTIMLVLLQGLF
jgi:hypothetical protein